jgi:hypothetical protein
MSCQFVLRMVVARLRASGFCLGGRGFCLEAIAVRKLRREPHVIDFGSQSYQLQPELGLIQLALEHAASRFGVPRHHSC